MHRSIVIYNSLSRQKETLRPIVPGQVGMYACGVTVYDACHVGHAMQAIFFDLVRGYLEASGYRVTYVRNFTDVDDKIIDRALKLGISPRKLADDMIAGTNADMTALGLRAPTCEPRVSEMIPEIIEMIAELMKKDCAYATAGGDVYYRVRRKQDYGKLSGQSYNEMQTGNRELAAVARDKDDELDFALWKSDAVEDASWESPWGNGRRGRPGWHIECSAMARKKLGPSFDIHGGGRDLIFPHHENEIAQSESANDAPFASMWMHSGLLTINKQKMSKSLGNSITIRDFLAKWHAEVLRLGFVQNHYRSNVDFSETVFYNCRRRLLYYYSSLRQMREILAAVAAPVLPDPQGEVETAMQAFHGSMADDFNTPQAIAALNTLLRKLNQVVATPVLNSKQLSTLAAGVQAVREMGGILGFLKEDPDRFVNQHFAQVLQDLGITEHEIEAAIAERNQARQNKNWEKSDAIRTMLLTKGISLRDSKERTTWGIAEF